MSNGWIGVDLDGTLAEYHGWHSDGGIGPPIARMVNRIRLWRSRKFEVRIMTARVGASGRPSTKHGELDDQAFAESQRRRIEAWCLEHIGEVLPVTATKDLDMLEIWDDRAVAVELNTGRAFSFRYEVNNE
jgi:hypothetical protein